MQKITVRFVEDFKGAEPPGIHLLEFADGDVRELHPELAEVAIELGVAIECEPESDTSPEPETITINTLAPDDPRVLAAVGQAVAELPPLPPVPEGATEGIPEIERTILVPPGARATKPDLIGFLDEYTGERDGFDYTPSNTNAELRELCDKLAALVNAD